ncbi:hypothetical protein BV898_07068 [Hypsibius exemplaris]|uniref:Uncharacterized protein n=1 Tax=Hypsibius exemplaris TaxID=2072580 RepID=A0A1W0WUD1_HYPEX|nr:hypothetical protein BV898_07068 [Hypsibius exemplaris]
MLNSAGNDSAKMAMAAANAQEDDGQDIPVIQVTEPLAEKLKEKPDPTEGAENVLQMIIDQQKSKRKKFIFREGGQQSSSGSVEDRSIVRGESSDSLDADSSSSPNPHSPAGTVAAAAAAVATTTAAPVGGGSPTGCVKGPN